VQRRGELAFLARALGYGAITVAFIATGVAGLIDGNMAGIAALVAGGVFGGMAGLYGYAASLARRQPPPLLPPVFPRVSGFLRPRLIVLAVASGLLGLFGVLAIVVGVVEHFRGGEFVGYLDVGVVVLAYAWISGTTAWARWPSMTRYALPPR